MRASLHQARISTRPFFRTGPSIFTTRMASSSTSLPQGPQTSKSQDPQSSDIQNSQPSTPQTPSQNPDQQPPLPLPSPSSSSTATKIDMSTGSQTVKLDHLGPLVVNKDGTLSRIGNWAEMSEIERQNTVRILGKRNMLRREALTKEEQEGK